MENQFLPYNVIILCDYNRHKIELESRLDYVEECPLYSAGKCMIAIEDGAPEERQKCTGEVVALIPVQEKKLIDYIRKCLREKKCPA